MRESTKLIGNTPMLRLENTNIYIKLEKFNAGGSVKDRAVLGMLSKAMEKGKLVPGDILVEATSGNTGIALAMLGAMYNIEVIIFMPESMSLERRQLVKAYGAQLVLTPASQGMKGAMEAMNAYKQEHVNAKSLDQFDNEDNVLAHYETTGKEMLKQVEHIDMFVACVGTGGTFSGVAKRLKEHDPSIMCIAGEPEKSALLSGQEAGSHKIQGIGANFVPGNFHRELCDDIMLVSDEEALRETKAFVKETGILVGISSGANIALAKRLAWRNPDKTIVTIAPDGGEKYLSVLDF
ncbi:MAG: cysteine synthase family protein [Amedibacillus dolichus]|uniref:cysteine synthase n=1 Tax=Amedibacillus dolichus TaxID=31971 RepID=A0A943A282_9FIRM|nr:cysteine synthase family protein [Amedibacillus dolichus]MBS4883345.1 cysteine synthase family protein [Amedibacillus dolichus]MEE0383551.1 cysteine synthase family protein [Amedibacillus dolichus]